MTNISRWPELVQVVKLRAKDSYSDEWLEWRNAPDDDPQSYFEDYALMPFNEYQIGHLLGMLARSEDNGDWHDEIISLCAVAMDKWGLKKVINNWGDIYTFEEVVSRAFLTKKTNA